MISNSDRAFRRRVESCEWDQDFTHEDHIRLAWIYLQEFERSEATDRCRTALRCLAESHGDFEKYHDTLTIAFMRLISSHVDETPPSEDWPAFRARVRPLFESARQLIGRHYSKERLNHPAARHSFITPDLEPLGD